MRGSRKHGWGRGLGGEGGSRRRRRRAEAPKEPREGRGVSPSTADQEVWGSVPKTDFSTFQDSQNACCLNVCRKPTSGQKTFVNGINIS